MIEEDAPQVTEYTLNVGLARNDGRVDNSVEQTLGALGVDFLVTGSRVAYSSSERTVVVTISTGEDPHKLLYALSKALGQECIAYQRTGSSVGWLVGPEAKKWGCFDLNQFISYEGK